MQTCTFSITFYRSQPQNMKYMVVQLKAITNFQHTCRRSAEPSSSASNLSAIMGVMLPPSSAS